MTGTTLDPTRRHLVPVAPVALAHEPDDVHLALYEWNPRLGEWLTGWAICGRSSTQGRLPDGTTATCAECLELRAGYVKALDATPAADCGPECAEQHTYANGCEAQIHNSQTHNEPVVDEGPECGLPGFMSCDCNHIDGCQHPAPPADATADTEGSSDLVCVCGDPIVWLEHDTEAGWIHAPGSDTTCVYARPRCPNCGLPHLLTPGMTHVCASIRADVARPAPAPSAGRCAARLDRDGEHWACDRPIGHPGGHSSGEPWEAGYNAWTDRAAGASLAPADGALRDQIAKALHRYDHEHGLTGNDIPGDHHRGEAAAVLPVIEQHTAQLRQQADDLIRRNAEYADRAIANGERAEKADADLRRVSALHADTERRLRADLADEVRKREAAEHQITAVRQLHWPEPGEIRAAAEAGIPAACAACRQDFPCPTYRATEAPKEPTP